VNATRPLPVVLVVGGPVTPARVPELCARVRAIAAARREIVCEVAPLEADLVALEALARMQLTARRLGSSVRIRGPSVQLAALLDAAGLADVFREEQPMGKIVLMSSISLDGFIEGPNREIDWHLVDDEVHREVNRYLDGAASFLSGRVTHELMAQFWPTADEDPANAGPMAEFAAIWRETPKVVYSRTLAEAGWNTTIVHQVVPEEVERLKAEAGGDLVLSGADLAATFLRLGLVDELRLYVHPVAIGQGKPLFPRSDRYLPARLVETHVFGNGVVLLRYEVSGGATRTE
jgi:dihydrofolate reductase/ABC-type transporter Mla MlaB component